MDLPRKISEDFIIKLMQDASAAPAGELGIGDDAAVWPLDSERVAVLTTDLLVEDVHFLRAEISARDLGFKSLAVNLSDVAAMGAVPRRAFISLALPADLPPAWMAEWAQGLADLASEFGVQIMGGDTTRSPGPIFINIALNGEAPVHHIKRRSTARAGDALYVTGPLGDSRAGLEALLGDPAEKRDALATELIRRHHRSRPHVREGEWLGARAEVSAMMDVSDGLRRDLGRLAKSSRVGFEVMLESLPVSSTLRRRVGDRAPEFALEGGEDYVLLLSVEPARAQALEAEYARVFEHPLVQVGTVQEATKGFSFAWNGRPFLKDADGFEHF